MEFHHRCAWYLSTLHGSSIDAHRRGAQFIIRLLKGNNMKTISYCFMLIFLATSSFLPKQAYAVSYAAAVTAKLEAKTKAWEQLRVACEQKGTIDLTCAQEAYDAAIDLCETEAGRYQKRAGGTQWFYIGAIAVASVATALGASTLASAKAWGVFGGTTGVGALSTAASSETTNFENDLSTIRQDISDLKSFKISKTGTPPALPDPATVFDTAVATIGLCKSVGNTSPAATSTTPAK